MQIVLKLFFMHLSWLNKCKYVCVCMYVCMYACTCIYIYPYSICILLPYVLFYKMSGPVCSGVEEDVKNLIKGKNFTDID